MQDRGQVDISEPVNHISEDNEIPYIDIYEEIYEKDEYKTTVETILKVHSEEIVTDSSQILIQLLERYITKINTPHLSASLFDQPGRKTDIIMAKHGLNLLKADHAANHTSDATIYVLLGYLNSHHDELDVRLGTTQILSAFFSLYRHYIEGFSEALTKQLRIRNAWDDIIFHHWVYPLLNKVSFGNSDDIEAAFEKLFAVQKWIPENILFFQRFFTMVRLADLNNIYLSTKDRKLQISGIERLHAWIAPSIKDEMIKRLISFVYDPELTRSVQGSLRKLIDDKTFSEYIDPIVNQLILTSQDTTLNSIYHIKAFRKQASLVCQTNMMAYFAREFLSTSNHYIETSLCKAINQLHLPLPSNIQDDVLAKVIRLLTTDINFPHSKDNRHIFDTFIQMKDNMTSEMRENLCYDLFVHFIIHPGWSDFLKIINKHFSQLIEMMSIEKRTQLIEYARSSLVVTFELDTFESRNSFLISHSDKRINAITVITALIDTVPKKRKMHTQFLNDLMTIVLDPDESSCTISAAMDKLNHIQWELSDEYRKTTIDNLLILINKKVKCYILSKKPFILNLIVYLSSNLSETACNDASDKLLALIHHRRDPHLKKDVVLALTKLQVMVTPEKSVTVAESLVAYFNNRKKKKIVRESIAHFIEQEQKRNPLPIYETAIPTLIDIIQSRTKRSDFQIAACQALCQFSANICQPELKVSITSVLIEAIKNATATRLWEALYQAISTFKEWLSPEQKSQFMSDLIAVIPGAKKYHQVELLKIFFTLRDWLSPEQQSYIPKTLLVDFLDNLNKDNDFFQLQNGLMPILNELERTSVIHYLITHLNHTNIREIYSAITGYIGDISDNDKISLLARLQVLGSQGEGYETNMARSWFIKISQVYHQGITEKLLSNVAERHHLPVELSQHIWQYALV